MAGLSFLPSATPSATDRNASRALSPGQSPIDVISLNLPRILGARPLASANLLGVGPAAPPVSPQQMVMQALMQSSMATPTTSAMNPALSQAGTSPLGATPSMATGSAEEELRKRLTELFGMSTASQPSPSFGGTSNGATTTPSPVFRPGDAGTDPVPPLPTPVPLQPTPSPGPTPSPAPRPGTFSGSLPDRTNRMRQ